MPRLRSLQNLVASLQDPEVSLQPKSDPLAEHCRCYTSVLVIRFSGCWSVPGIHSVAPGTEPLHVLLLMMSAETHENASIHLLLPSVCGASKNIYSRGARTTPYLNRVVYRFPDPQRTVFTCARHTFFLSVCCEDVCTALWAFIYWH